MKVKLLEGDESEVVVLFSRDACHKIVSQDEAERGCFNLTDWSHPLRRLYDWAVYFKFFDDRRAAGVYLERFGFGEGR